MSSIFIKLIGWTTKEWNKIPVFQKVTNLQKKTKKKQKQKKRIPNYKNTKEKEILNSISLFHCC